MDHQYHSRSFESNEELVSRFQRALGRLREWRIDPSPSSRFPQYLRRYESLLKAPCGLVSQADVHQLQFDLREIDEFVAIVDSFPNKLSREAHKRVKLMVTGSEHPDSESESAGRDAQWELYLRALLRRAQIPAGLGNPDIIATVRRRRIPIEAKRPKSEARLDDRLRKAVSQIEASGTPGVVALSLDRAIRAGGDVLIGPSLSGLEAEVTRLVVEMVMRNLHSIVKRVQNRPVLGLIFHARLPTWVAPLDHPQLVTAAHVEVVSKDPEAKLVLARLLEGLNTA